MIKFKFLKEREAVPVAGQPMRDLWAWARDLITALNKLALTPTESGGWSMSHSALGNLDADDHPQYLLKTDNSWDNLPGKPSSFPPSAHTHPIAQIVGLDAELDDIWDEFNDVYVAIEASNLPTGGSTGQVLTKTSGADFAATWQTPSGGGGGSGLFYDSLLMHSANSASGTAFATKGIYLTPLADIELNSIVASITLVAGATYRARVYEVTNATTSGTIVSILDNGVDFIAPAAATLSSVRLGLSNTVTLVEGTLYLIAVSRTDGGNTYALPIGSTTSTIEYPRGLAFPVAGLSYRGQIALAVPIVGSATAGSVANGGFSIGIIGDPSSLV